MSRLSSSWLVVFAAVAVLAVACGGSDPEPAPAPEPTATPVPTATPLIDIDALPVSAADIEALGLTEAHIQCLAGAVEAQVVTQLLAEDLSVADVFSVASALDGCGVDLAAFIEAADGLFGDAGANDFPRLADLPFTSQQLACLALAVDPELIEGLAEGQAGQADIVPLLETFSACGVGISELLELAGGLDPGQGGGTEVVPAEPVIPPPPEIQGIPELGDLPFSAEQIECLTNQIDLETLSGLASGEVSGLDAFSFIGTLSDCGVSLTDLAN